jgi:hypothetical protein
MPAFPLKIRILGTSPCPFFLWRGERESDSTKFFRPFKQPALTSGPELASSSPFQAIVNLPYLRNLYKALRTSSGVVLYVPGWYCTVALIALAAICFFASLFFFYVLLQWMRETNRQTINAVYSKRGKRVVLLTARRK